MPLRNLTRAGYNPNVMAKLQQEIADIFLKKLKDSPDISSTILDQLRELFSSGKKLRADDLVKVFSPPSGGDVK